MQEQDIQRKLKELLCKVLNNSEIEIDNLTTAEDIDEWDSLTNITIFDEIEKCFDIKFKLREILKLKNIGELTASIYNKIN